jgi:hypothetical protein
LFGAGQDTGSLNPHPEHAGQIIASLYECASCGTWWAASAADSPEARLLFRLVEPHSARYLWVDYRGWHHGMQAEVCAHCGRPAAAAPVVLRRDEWGHIIWPQEAPAQESVAGQGTPAVAAENPFLAYVSESAAMEENIAAIAAREAKRETHAWGYTVDIDDLRDEMAAQRDAFKHVVTSYAPLLPPGWRITADYDKWIQGKACAGFLHGEVSPDISLLIGGECRTVVALEMELDRLFRYICQGDV